MQKVGKTCFYRPLFCREVVTAVITSVEPRKTASGKVTEVLHLDNGDTQPIESVRFD